MCVVLLMIISGCSNFNGMRTPLYDGEETEPNTESIAVYSNSGEIIGAEKEYYFRYPFSQNIYEKSLDFFDEEPILLVDGEYTVGEDLPAGRVSLLGNASVFNQDQFEVHAGNLIIRDQAGEVYFENLFHSEYGPLVAQVDLIEGHEISIVGEDTEITVFYTPEFPENPYILMDLPEVMVNLERTDVKNPIVVEENGDVIHLTAGIYEVGTHLDAGTYEIRNISAAHNTEMYLFRENEEPRVFELLASEVMLEEEELDGEDEEMERVEATYKQIELRDHDKIYPNLVFDLELRKIDTE